MAAGCAPRAVVPEPFVEDPNRTAGVEVEVVDMGAMSVADVDEPFGGMEDDQHLDTQGLAEAGVLIRMILLGLLVGARDGVVGVDRVMLVDWDRCRGRAAAEARPRLGQG